MSVQRQQDHSLNCFINLQRSSLQDFADGSAVHDNNNGGASLTSAMVLLSTIGAHSSLNAAPSTQVIAFGEDLP